MPSQDDVQVRCAKRLAEIITGIHPTANVFHYWILGQGPIGESFPDVVSSTETEFSLEEGGWPHAYVLGYDAFPREKVANASFKDTLRFRLWGFYGFEKGTATKNSADIASVNWKKVQNGLSAATKFQQTGSPNGVPEVTSHGEWQITEAGVFWMGDHKVHIAQGEIEVYAKLIINMLPIA
jgi:hypothetical protein